MLTAHAMTTEALKNSIKLGAVFFLPEDKVFELPYFFEHVVLGSGRPIREKVFNRLGSYYNSRFGPDWKDRDKFFKKFEEALKKSE